MTLLERWKKTSLANQLMVITTAIVAFGTLFYVGVAIFQWKFMKESSYQTSIQNKRLISEARRIADTSSESARQAKEALDNTIYSFHQEQRAWVVPILVKSPEYMNSNNKKVYVKEGQPINCSVIVNNSGKTPAKNVQNILILETLKPPIVPDFAESFHFEEYGLTMLQPNMTMHNNCTPSPNVTESMFKELSNKKKILYLYGIIKYDDIFDRPHSTQYCFYLLSDFTDFTPCRNGNDPD